MLLLPGAQRGYCGIMDGRLLLFPLLLPLLNFGLGGVMHNYATEAAKGRLDYSGGFYDFTKREVESVPDWPAVVNLLSFIAAVGLLITGLVL